MSNQSRQPAKYPSGGVIGDLALNLKLIMKLMGDRRVSPLLKLFPLVGLIYLIFFPDFMLGPLDDAGVIALVLTLFVELCPLEVVEQHRRALRGVPPSAESGQKHEAPGHKEEDILDGVFHEVDEPPSPSNNGYEHERKKK